MARKNTQKSIYTHEGGRAKRIDPELMLRRSVLSCMLWEDTFYEDGESIAKRIAELVPKVDPEVVASLAIEAREEMNLRHAPLWLVRNMAKLKTHKHFVAETLARVIQRPDEMAEFLAIYWEDGRQPLSAQVKKGLAKAFTKFDEYQLAKYNRPGNVRLRDVLFLSHAKPLNEEQAFLWKRLINDELAVPDTWEVALSLGQDKKEVFERLMREEKLGAMAFLRNLRNMLNSGVDIKLMRNYIKKLRFNRVLPFRFIAAARYAPRLEPELEEAMLQSLKSHERLLGETVLLIDVSGSMTASLSEKSEMTRMEAASALAIILREISKHVRVYTFSRHVVEVAPRRGFALRDAIMESQAFAGTYLGSAVKAINNSVRYDRMIVVTDEQLADRVPDPIGRGYMINVAIYRNGVGYGRWVHIDGLSSAVVNWLQEYEKMGQFA